MVTGADICKHENRQNDILKLPTPSRYLSFGYYFPNYFISMHSFTIIY